MSAVNSNGHSAEAEVPLNRADEVKDVSTKSVFGLSESQTDVPTLHLPENCRHHTVEVARINSVISPSLIFFACCMEKEVAILSRQ